CNGALQNRTATGNCNGALQSSAQNRNEVDEADDTAGIHYCNGALQNRTATGNCNGALQSQKKTITKVMANEFKGY
ncbi:hypothetical protein, partial [Neisseria meningitidis]|uniref:hypothetical protein n=2 Tax=Neisseria TaxID=482 RepID=UPI000A9E513B